MTTVLDKARQEPLDPQQARVSAMIAYLRRTVLAAPQGCERFHAIFVDDRRAFLADATLGEGGSAALSVRMRHLFAKALSVGANGLIIAHNHPSGDCRPSAKDIVSTRRLKEIAVALDIELIDHLIITESAVYSMRAGGNL
ncbi:JAB domain-containing protein [Erythrobacter sp. THAF29]|uniref:JAB domain-containing protein n=1 Tax=Erythrobacter sp. THAF29 TaxID=2587851 RepID=UPI001267F5AB|nr:JAB domain-containing protein [Erythrobacter sp. THAF29]QFT78881.1 hypothetical protein FIU90_15135 [Erythrobacter sp. THAF29]